MKTLLEIKNHYAQEQGYEDWTELVIINELNADKLDRHWTEICIRAQKSALENAAENTEDLKYIDVGGYRILDATSITNSENLIR